MAVVHTTSRTSDGALACFFNSSSAWPISDTFSPPTEWMASPIYN